MVIYLPCKLGEEFNAQKFVDWRQQKRIYIQEEQKRRLKGFSAFDCNTRCLSIPILYTQNGFVSYDPLGELPQEYIPKYKINIDVKTEQKLSDIGFPSGKTARLYGLIHEHIRHVIADKIQYAAIHEEPMLSVIEYDPEATKRREEYMQSIQESERQLRHIRQKAAVRDTRALKKLNLKDIIKAKMQPWGTADDRKELNT